MRPGTTGALPKIVPPQGETVQGVFIPGGTLVAMNIPFLLRSPDLFGPDAGIFRPERWIEATDEQRADMEREVEMMFGSGRWMCAGKPIAFMELYKTFFEVCPDISRIRLPSVLANMFLGSCCTILTSRSRTRASRGIRDAIMSSLRKTCWSG